MISHKHKFLFIAVPKTASGTARKIFEDLYDVHSTGGDVESKNYYHHRTANDMKQHFGEMNWNYDKYFKFTFVRNPWSRTVSLWAYKTGKECSFKYFLNKNVVNSRKIDYTNYYCDENGNNLVDFIGKLENFQEDINTVCDKIGIPHRPLPKKHSHKTKHKHYTEYYDEETREIVAEKYAKDIEYFGYEFGE